MPIISAVQPIWAQKVSNKPLNIVCIFTDDHAFQTIRDVYKRQRQRIYMTLPRAYSRGIVKRLCGVLMN